MLDDGNVRLTFAQPKQSLEVFRTLAAVRQAAFDLLGTLGYRSDKTVALEGSKAQGLPRLHQRAQSEPISHLGQCIVQPGEGIDAVVVRAPLQRPVSGRQVPS